MENLKEISKEQLKTYCSRKKIVALSDEKLREIFVAVNNAELNLKGAKETPDIKDELKFWEKANQIVNREVEKRGMCLMYIGLVKGQEGYGIVSLLNMEDENFKQQAYLLLPDFDIPTLFLIQSQVREYFRENPALYGPYLDKVIEVAAAKGIGGK